MKKIRYLTDDEKDRTRPLWESIFPEDIGAFLDYYYSVKTKDNEILVTEEDGQIRSMLQLNPYRLRIGHKEFVCAYVIAVATEEKYRHQGLMRELLLQAMRDRYEKRQPFLFLIPVDEVIYRPFGFRFVMEQYYKEVTQGTECGYCLETVAKEEYEEAADFANGILAQQADVYTVRNAEYYRVLRQEAMAEMGDVCWILKVAEGQQESVSKIGLLSYTLGEMPEIREPVLKEGYDKMLDDILKSCFPGRQLHVFGLQSGQGRTAKNTIMIRSLYLPALFEGLRAEEELEFILRVHDNIIFENNGVFVWRVNQEESIFGTEGMSCRQGLDLDVSVEALSQLVFGGKSIDEISRSELLIMTPQAKRKWEKISLPNRVFLNEVV